MSASELCRICADASGGLNTELVIQSLVGYSGGSVITNQ